MIITAAEQLTLAINNTLPMIQNLSFHIKQGQIVCFIKAQMAVVKPR